MGQLKWYKRDPEAALNGMSELTLEERGAYNTVLDLLYSRDGNLKDDDRFIAGWCSCDLRVWRRIKTRLIALGKITIEEGYIRNARALREVATALGRVVAAKEAGEASAKAKAAKSKGKSKKNSDKASTDVGTDASTGVSTIHNHTLDLPSEEESAKALAYSDEIGGGNPKPDLDLLGDPIEPPSLQPQHVAAEWNKVADRIGRPKILSLDANRRALASGRISQFALKEFFAVFDKVEASPFLRGEKGWKGVTFDWLMQKKNFTKVLEGNYDG